VKKFSDLTKDWSPERVAKVEAIKSDLWHCLDPTHHGHSTNDECLPSPPAPPRSEQETARKLARCPEGVTCRPVHLCHQVAAALAGAARDAAKKERERCAKALCGDCYAEYPTRPFKPGEKVWHFNRENGDEWKCRAQTIRALPPEEGK
jgi:hypothetical protein